MRWYTDLPYVTDKIHSPMYKFTTELLNTYLATNMFQPLIEGIIDLDFAILCSHHNTANAGENS